jgi:hypothetical protein
VAEKAAGRIILTDDYELADAGWVESKLIALERPLPDAEDPRAPRFPSGLRIELGPGLEYAGAERCEYRNNPGVEMAVERLSFRPTAPASAGRLEMVFSVE